MSSVDKRYRYVARVGRFTGRYGQIVTVLKWHRSRVLVQFPDGWIVLCPGRCLRKIAGPQRGALGLDKYKHL